MTVSTKGFRELGEALATLRERTAQKICVRAVAGAAQFMKKKVSTRAPALKEAHLLYLSHGDVVNVPPGNLKENVIVKRIKSPLTAEYIVTVRGKSVAHYAARYARLVEFGTVNFSPKPFMRPAFDANRDQAVEIIRKILDVGIKQATVKK